MPQFGHLFRLVLAVQSRLHDLPIAKNVVRRARRAGFRARARARVRAAEVFIANVCFGERDTVPRDASCGDAHGEETRVVRALITSVDIVTRRFGVEASARASTCAGEISARGRL